jgi:hypothetical protein
VNSPGDTEGESGEEDAEQFTNTNDYVDFILAKLTNVHIKII